jgi:hypothetical protein
MILPNSQILYTEVTAPGPSRDEKRRQIAAALEGRTPYPVEDLVFDWSGKGATVKVAVIARETLDEAEGFAATHRLNPVSFVAIPPKAPLSVRRGSARPQPPRRSSPPARSWTGTVSR